MYLFKNTKERWSRFTFMKLLISTILTLTLLTMSLHANTHTATTYTSQFEHMDSTYLYSFNKDYSKLDYQVILETQAKSLTYAKHIRELITLYNLQDYYGGMFIDTDGTLVLCIVSDFIFDTGLYDYMQGKDIAYKYVPYNYQNLLDTYTALSKQEARDVMLDVANNCVTLDRDVTIQTLADTYHDCNPVNVKVNTRIDSNEFALPNTLKNVNYIAYFNQPEQGLTAEDTVCSIGLPVRNKDNIEGYTTAGHIVGDNIGVGTSIQLNGEDFGTVVSYDYSTEADVVFIRQDTYSKHSNDINFDVDLEPETILQGTYVGCLGTYNKNVGRIVSPYVSTTLVSVNGTFNIDTTFSTTNQVRPGDSGGILFIDMPTGHKPIAIGNIKGGYFVKGDILSETTVATRLKHNYDALGLTPIIN